MRAHDTEVLSVLNDQSPAPCASCSRRDFMSGSVMMAVGALLAACGDGVIGSGGSNTLTGPVNLTVKVSDYSALTPVGGIARISGTSTPIAVVHSAASTYLAFSMICPHQGTTIDINGSGFKCPNHGAQFNSAGQWISSSQRTSNLQQLGATFDATTGTVTIT